MFKNLIRCYSKVYSSSEELVSKIKPGMTVMSGGFGLCGIPVSFLRTLSKHPEINNLTLVSNNIGVQNEGLGLLLPNKQIKKMIASYVGENKLFEKMYFDGDIELEITP